MFFGFIMQIASFDLLPMEKFYDNNFDMEQTQAINDNFESLGFGSMFLLYNMGSLIIAWLSIPVLAIIIFFLQCFNCCIKRSPRLNRWKTRLETWMFWGHPITVFNESASIIYMCCLVNMQNATFNTTGDRITTVLAICFLIIAMVLPFLFTFIMMWNSYRLNDPEFRGKYGAIYEGLNTERGRLLAF